MNNITSNNNPNFYWWFGVVEDRDDPLRLGRCRIRILGYHTDDKEELPTDHLPWAIPVMPSNSASTSGVGWSPTGAVEGSWCVGFFADGEDGQHPMFFGTVGAIPGGLAGTGCGDGSGSGQPGDSATGSPSSQGNERTPSFTAEEMRELDFGGSRNVEARQIAEEFLGRRMTDQEWNYLVRATVAESAPNSPLEQASIMAVILNRARTNYGRYGNGVIDQLRARSQFQAVTGTSADGNRPSSNFTNPPKRQIASVVNATIEHLRSRPKSWMNFTARSSAAYGRGTNIGFRDRAIARGATPIGGTLFGTWS